MEVSDIRLMNQICPFFFLFIETISEIQSKLFMEKIKICKHSALKSPKETSRANKSIPHAYKNHLSNKGLHHCCTHHLNYFMDDFQSLLFLI